MRQPSGKAQGRESAFQGEKLQFLEGYKEDFLTRPRGAFYDDITKQFVTRYGYDLGVEKNVEGPIDAWIPVDRKAGLTQAELVVENNWQAAYVAKLRGKLGNWYRNRYTGKKVHSATLNNILKRMQAIAEGEKRPRRTPDVTLYSSKYYTLRMKAGFDELWASVKDTVPRGHRVSMCQDYVRGCWDKETEEFRRGITEESDAAYATAFAKYRARENTAKQGAKEYHNALESFDEVGIPLADALSERLGMHVMILAVGPVGSQRGEVRLRSIFSDTSAGQTSKMWGEFDRTGFTAAEASITRYGRSFFTKEACRERIWPPPETPDMSELLSLDGTGSAAAVGGSASNATTTVETAPVERASRPASANPASRPASPNPASRPASPNPASRPASPAPATPDEPRSDTPEPDVEGYAKWTKTQRGAYKLMQEKEGWGPRWTELIGAMLAFEESRLWETDGQLRPSHIRPEEYKVWMKEHRTAGDFNKVQAGFGERMLEWWRLVGPMGRGLPKPEGMGEEEAWPVRSAWACLRQGGDNGVLLVILGLIWWGQQIVNEAVGEGLGAGEAALAGNEQWQFLLGDLLYALRCITEEPGSAVRVALEHKKMDEEALDAWLAGGSKGKRPKDGDAAKAARKAALAVTKEAKVKEKARAKAAAPARPQRKRGREDDTSGEDERAAQKAKTAEEESRPKPRRILKTRVTGTTEAASTQDAAAVNGAAPAEASTLGGLSGGRVKDGEMEEGARGAKQPNAAGEDEGSVDPFAADPMAGMSAQEREWYAAEQAEMDGDPDADDEEDEE
ncbi:hypothetical protein C8R46DRAFT_1206600 [Mycena filopes]|nr:hypothetical protein C8R46DRAFT_1206600 [Mycena filopes]